MSQFLDSLKDRRSFYSLGRDVQLTEEEITELVKDSVKNSPTAFNAQSPRAVFFLVMLMKNYGISLKKR